MDSRLLLVLMVLSVDYCRGGPLKYVRTIEDVDKDDTFCPPDIGEMLSFYCLVHPDYSASNFDNSNGYHRSRGIIDMCCYRPCSFRFLIDNFCKKMRPEHNHLFVKNATNELRPSTTIEIKPLGSAKSPNELTANLIVQGSDKDTLGLNVEKERDRKNTCDPSLHRCRRLRNVRKRKLSNNKSSSLLSLKRLRNRRNNQKGIQKVCRCSCKPVKKNVPKAIMGTDRPIDNYPVYIHVDRDIDDESFQESF